MIHAAMSDVSNDSDQDVINVDLDEDEYNFEDYDGINTPPTNTVAAATDPSAAVTNPSALTDSAATPSTASAATPTVFADIHHTPMNLSAAPTQPGAGATVVTAPRGLGASTSIHPITLKDALNGTTTPRATTTEVTKPVGKHEYRGRTSCDRCRDPQKEKCVLKPGNSDCDRCRRLGHVCQWTFAGTPGGRYHQERFGRVPLSGPWLRLCADAATAPVAANGGNAFDEAGSGGDAPLPQPFDYYSGEEVVNEEEADEAADEDEDDDVDMEQEES